MRHNGRAPIKASTMRPEHLNLRDGEPRLVVCPDCDTWHRLTRSMIRPHRDGTDTPKTGERRYLGDKPAGGRRCPGSAQRITIDVDITEWGHKAAEADATAMGRRSGRVNSKPRAAVPTPVHRVASVPGPSTRLLAAQTQARDAVNQHRGKCGVCRTGRTRCPVGRELEIRMGHTDAAVRLAHEQHESALRAAAAPTIPRTQQWRRVAADVERADKRRMMLPAGDAPLESPPVPLDTLRPKPPAR
ncbi:hypothetical protein [Streptomyces sp. NPDC050388]|uniref:hypothetical protein n=1 Tax=Streptomyces sp. NPDC050388 TaxID=3155781 RepID=UPI00341A0780